MIKTRVISITLILFILISTFSLASLLGIGLWREEGGLSGLFSSDVLGVPLTQRTLANVSVFLILPFLFGGMLMALYQWSIDFAMKAFNAAGVIVSFIGGVINYFFSLTISFFSF